MMKRLLLLFLMGLGSIFGTFAQGKDLIVLMDTSKSLFDYYQELVDTFLVRVVKEQLQQGDTFHLISFDVDTNQEIRRTINNSDDLDIISARLNQLIPLGPNTDLMGGISEAYRYARGLNPNIPKTIVILTDGIHDSVETSTLEPSEVENTIRTEISLMQSQGWEVIFLRIGGSTDSPDITIADGNNSLTDGQFENGSINPADNNETPQDNPLSNVSTDLNVLVVDFDPNGENEIDQLLGVPRIEWPQQVQWNQTDLLKLNFINETDKPFRFKITQVLMDGGNILIQPVNVLLSDNQSRNYDLPIEIPVTVSPGEYEKEFSLLVDSDQRPYPLVANIAFKLKADSGFIMGNLNWFVFFLIVILVLSAVFFGTKALRKTTAHVNRHVEDENNTIVGFADKEEENTVKKQLLQTVSTSGASVVGSMKANTLAPQNSQALSTQNKEAASLEQRSRIPGQKSQNSLDGFSDQFGKTSLEMPSLRNKPSVQDFLNNRKDQKPNHLSALEELSNRKQTKKQLNLKKPNFQQAASILTNINEPEILMEVMDHHGYIQNRSFLGNRMKLKDGKVRTVGSPPSSYTITIRKVRGVVAKVWMKEDKLYFEPYKKELFPEIEGVLEGCVGQVISLHAEDFSLYLHFSVYIRPEEKINAILSRGKL